MQRRRDVAQVVLASAQKRPRLRSTRHERDESSAIARRWLRDRLELSALEACQQTLGSFRSTANFVRSPSRSVRRRLVLVRIATRIVRMGLQHASMFTRSLLDCRRDKQRKRVRARTRLGRLGQHALGHFARSARPMSRIANYKWIRAANRTRMAACWSSVFQEML